jgi:hypothetical protein
MAIFEGSIQEFHHYVGPRIRNAVNSFARTARNTRNGVCEDCEKSGQELDSAHVHGRDRRTIIETVLSRYESNGVVRCDVALIEKEILSGHGDVKDAFKFLCKKCHVEYDNGHRVIKGSGTATGFMSAQNADNSLRLHFFPDETRFKLLLLQWRRAYVLLIRSDGTGTISEWNASRFKESSNLRGNLFSGYLRDWRAKGIVKAVFAIDKADLKHFADSL